LKDGVYFFELFVQKIDFCHKSTTTELLIKGNITFAKKFNL